MIPGCGSSSLELDAHLPAGHHLCRARRRHLGESEWIVASTETHPIGFAAYKRADSEVRVVHEWLLDPAISQWVATAVTEGLLSAVEMIALEDRVTCMNVPPAQRRHHRTLREPRLRIAGAGRYGRVASTKARVVRLERRVLEPPVSQCVNKEAGRRCRPTNVGGDLSIRSEASPARLVIS